MVTDSELVDRLREFLKTADLTTTTTATVRRQLELEFDVDLSEKKKFIRDQVDLYLSELENENKDEEEREEEESGVKEEVSEVEEEVVEPVEVKRTSKRKSPKINEKVKKGNTSGINKPCSLSPQLEELIGESELARSEVVKRIWAYIRENNLQDPSNRKNILCDEKLQNLFKVQSINMFQMSKALSKHIWPLQSEEGGPAQKEKITSNDSGGPAQKEKKSASKRKKPSENSDEPQAKKQKGGNLLVPLQISDALAKFIGTGEELTRSDAVKRIWAYIKENNLQNPAEKKTVLCDEKLKELFQVDSFNGFSVSKLLAAHLTKKT